MPNNLQNAVRTQVYEVVGPPFSSITANRRLDTKKSRLEIALSAIARHLSIELLLDHKCSQIDVLACTLLCRVKTTDFL